MPERIISMKTLGRHGRTANQIFQASFLYCYGQLHDIEVQAPDFPAQSLFNFYPELVSVTLQDKEERYSDKEHNRPIAPEGEEFVGHNFLGYAQWNTAWYAPWKYELMGMVNRHAWLPKDRTKIGIHIRLGDYDCKTVKWTCPIQWYLDWLDQHWGDYKDPLLYVAAEEQHIIDHFEKYMEPESRSPVPARMSIDRDWQCLNQCDVVLCPNSTYSFSAAWLNPDIQEAWRASLPHGGFTRFDPWCSTPLLYDFIEDYPDVKAICP